MKIKGQRNDLVTTETLASLFPGRNERSRDCRLESARGGSIPPTSTNLMVHPLLVGADGAHPQAEAEGTGFLRPPSFSL